MDLIGAAAIIAGVFFLAFGIVAYRYFYYLIGAAAGIMAAVLARKTMLRLPGLSTHPGLAGILIFLLFILLGVFLATKFRKILAFLGGLGTGVFLYRVIAAVWVGGDVVKVLTSSVMPGPMELLAGAVFGVLFMLFEYFFALVLTSVIGAWLCTWVLGGRWTFAATFAIGLVAQPLISRRFLPGRVVGRGDKTRAGRKTRLLLLAMLLFPVSSSNAEMAVHHVIYQSGRVVLDVGKTAGVRKGEVWAVLSENGDLMATVVVSEVFADTSYTQPVSTSSLGKIRKGMAIVEMETYEFNRARELESEAKLQDFLDKYPDSRYRTFAADAVDRIRFARALSGGTLESFAEFRKKYPGSQFGQLALSKEEKLAFEKAFKGGTEDSFLAFVQEYPGNPYLTQMKEARLFLYARKVDRVYAFQEFLAQYPQSALAGEVRARIAEFGRWGDELEFGSRKIKALQFFGSYGDETAVPLLVGKLLAGELAPYAKRAIYQIGPSAVAALLEVLQSPLQEPALMDEVVEILAGMGDVTAVPGLRTYAREKGTERGLKALHLLEAKLGR